MKHLLPKEAFALLAANADALLIDVRMEVELQYVGHPPNAINIPWYEYPALKTDGPAFVETIDKPVSYTHLDVYKRQI